MSELTDSPTIPPILGVTLETVPDDLDNATHTRMNNSVLKLYIYNDPPLHEALGTLLLTIVVSTSEG